MTVNVIIPCSGSSGSGTADLLHGRLAGPAAAPLAPAGELAEVDREAADSPVTVNPPTQVGVPVVFDLVIGPSREVPGYEGPPVII